MRHTQCSESRREYSVNITEKVRNTLTECLELPPLALYSSSEGAEMRRSREHRKSLRVARAQFLINAKTKETSMVRVNLKGVFEGIEELKSSKWLIDAWCRKSVSRLHTFDFKLMS